MVNLTVTLAALGVTEHQCALYFYLCHPNLSLPDSTTPDYYSRLTFSEDGSLALASEDPLHAILSSLW
jgi:hypothetical protein